MILVLTGIFALRTPPLDPSWVDMDELPRKMILLWSNHLEYGHYLLVQGKPEEALRRFEKADELSPGKPLLKRWRAVALREMERWEDSAALLDALLASDPSDMATLREMDRLARKWDQAAPGSPRPWEWMARWFDRIGEKEKARLAHEKAAERKTGRNAAPAMDEK